jgi:ABC-2 type transport system permease protein
VGVCAVLFWAALAGQAAYRRSFALELVGQGLIVGLEFMEIFAVFHQVGAIDGFAFREVLVIFGLASTAFALADLAVGQMSRVSERIRAGTFEVLLVRPLSPLVLVATSDVQLRRVGRLGVAVAALAVALARADVEWTPSRLALLVSTPIAGAVIYSALFIAGGAITFWVVEGREAANALTYGTGYLSQWPFGVFGLVVGRFFTFVVPAAAAAYLPALAILGRTDTTGLPGWMSWTSPLAAAWAALLAGWLWRAAVRHYVGAGG